MSRDSWHWYDPGFIWIGIVAMILMLCLAGCTCPQKAIDQAQTEVAVHNGVIRIWSTLTPAQRYKAYQMSRDAWIAQTYALTGNEP